MTPDAGDRTLALPGVAEMFMNNLKISKKILVAFAALILVSALSSAVVFMKQLSIEDMTLRNDVTFDLALDVKTAGSAVVEQMNAVRTFALSGEDK